MKNGESAFFKCRKAQYGSMKKLYLVGQRICQIRESRNLTQEQLADLVGTKQTVIARYENGRAVPRDDMLIKISNALEIEMGYLKYGDMYYFEMEDYTEGIDIYLRHIRPVSYLIDAQRYSVTLDYYQLAEDHFTDAVYYYFDKLSKDQKAIILELMWSLKNENELAEMKNQPDLSEAQKEQILKIEKSNKNSDMAKVKAEQFELEGLLDQFDKSR